MLVLKSILLAIAQVVGTVLIAAVCIAALYGLFYLLSIGLWWLSLSIILATVITGLAIENYRHLNW